MPVDIVEKQNIAFLGGNRGAVDDEHAYVILERDRERLVVVHRGGSSRASIPVNRAVRTAPIRRGR